MFSLEGEIYTGLLKSSMDVGLKHSIFKRLLLYPLKVRRIPVYAWKWKKKMF